MAQMPQLNKEILEDVEHFENRYYVFDEPVPFKEHIYMYPVSVRDYNEFLSCSSCLTLNKNDSVDGIRMTNIEYLVSKMKEKETGPIMSLKFTKVLELCLHIKAGLKCPKCGNFLTFEELYEKINSGNFVSKEQLFLCECGGEFYETIKFAQNEKGKLDFFFDNVRIEPKDFNKLRQYLMYQNLPDYKDDSWVDQSVREDQALKAELTSKNSGSASLERKIVAVALQMGMKIEDVCNMSMRKFLICLNLIDDIMNYQINKQAVSSGFAQLPKGQTIDHWLYKKKEGMYGKAVDAGAYSSQFSKQ